jgi:hypothetical protein
VYPSGASRRHRRNTAQRRDWLRSVRDGLGVVGSGAALFGLWLLGSASPSKAYLGLGLVAVGALLMIAAACAALRVGGSKLPDPPAMGVQPVRYHIDDAPTVLTGWRGRQR